MDACGDPAEYRPGGLTVDDAGNIAPAEFDLRVPTVGRPLPVLPDALVIGTTVDTTACSAVRLVDVLRYVRRDEPVDMSAHAAFLYGSDANLRRLARCEGTIGRRLASADVQVVISPAFSTWWDWSPFDSLTAMALSANFAITLAEHVPTIPTVVWRHRHDLVRWSEWIAVTGAEAIAVDLGTLRRADHWAWGMSGLAVLAEQLAMRDATPRIVVHGPSTVGRMMDVRRRWAGRLTFASQAPWLLAAQGHRMDHDLQRSPSDDDRAELAMANQATFANVVHQVITSLDVRRRAG